MGDVSGSAMSLHVVREGPEHRPPVVMIHGAMDRHNSFRRAARRLPHERIVSYDRRGYGRSERARATCDFAKHVADLVEIIGDKPAVLIGHSMGGLVALHTAAVYPRLVLAVGAWEPPLPWRRWWPTQWTPNAESSDADVVRTFHERVIGPGSWDRVAASLQDQYVKEGHALRNDLNVGLDGPLFDAVDIVAPVVMGHGSESSESHRRAVAELVDELPDARLVVIDGARHGAHRSHPDAFADFVQKVIDRVDQPNC